MSLSTLQTPMVLAMTRQWLVVNKPPGWLTIPGRPAQGGTVPQVQGVLSDWVRAQEPQTWVVHRLDRDTSGVVLFARSSEDHRLANEWFSRHQVKKAYDCLAVGIPKSPMLKIKRPVAGQPSVSQVEVKETYREGFLARVVPVTGRRHQIRIHLSEEGHPLWGDPTYGGPTQVTLGGALLSLSRVALHSARLELPTREVFEAPWREDFQGWVERLRVEGSCV